MSSFPTLGCTRRIKGRRALTPMRSKRKKHIKTRSNPSVKRNVLVSKPSDTRLDSQRSQSGKKEQCDSEGKQGSQGSGDQSEQQSPQVIETLDDRGDQCNSNRPIHPGSIQGLPNANASQHELDETELQEEEPPF